MSAPRLPKVRIYDPKRHKVDASWSVSLKIDGVQAIRSNGTWTSRAGKPLYNLPTDVSDGIYEVYLGDWASSVSAVRTQDSEPISAVHLFQLYPHLDNRLKYCMARDPIPFLFGEVKDRGYEGLILRGPDGTLLKVKDKVTYDVPVIGYQPGTGKHMGRMGALITPMGKVGTGFSDKDREWWADTWHRNFSQLQVGVSIEQPLIIEVEAMELTPDGKFRHPRFVRLRPDKSA